MSAHTDSTVSRETSSHPSTDSPLSKDTIFHLLQVQRRRYILEYLHGTTDSVQMRELAEHVAGREHNTTSESLSSAQRQRTYISLYQTHLPTLDEEGVISYDQSRGVVERTAVADHLDPYLTTEHTQKTKSYSNAALHTTATVNQRWACYYLWVACISSWFLVGKGLQIPLLSHIDGHMLLLMIVLAFNVTTIGYRYSLRALPSYAS